MGPSFHFIESFISAPEGRKKLGIWINTRFGC